jgi:L-seryl-tRNA(Ser) seleniumtransferase
LPKAVWDAAGNINTGYSNLEFNLDSGERGPRGGLVLEYLCALTGAQAALAVNNNAAAILLALSALTKGKEVLVSRGEAVQIGGGFRIPDILALSGALLKEVGTTNITTTEDYLDAISPDTAAVLLVHSSNFALRGFVEKPSLSALNQALPKGIFRIVDQGSGILTENLGSEPSASSLLRAGADLVCFSGDKILGGPQAGLVAGRTDLIALLARHPLMRAFRPGKTVLSLLEASLGAMLKAEDRKAVAGGPSAVGTGGAAGTESAAASSLRLSAEPGLKTLRALARSVLRRLSKDHRDRIRLLPSRATLGGGSTPDETIPSLALRVSPLCSARTLTEELRRAPLPLVARIENESVLVDLIALSGEDPRDIAATLSFAMAKETP